MKKILIVAYYFPPVAASGAMRPSAFCRFLESYGWSPRVLTVDPSTVFPSQPFDAHLAAKLPTGVRVDFVRHRNLLKQVIAWRDQLKAILYRKQKDRSSTPGGPFALVTTKHKWGLAKLNSLKNLVLDWSFEFPDPQCGWFKPAVAHSQMITAGEVPDIVFATGGPWTSLLVGKRIAEYWGVPLIVDYRDPWTSNPYYSFVSSFLKARSRQLEGSVCKKASRVIANTYELQIQLEKDYPCLVGKTVTITNGFDPTSFGACQVAVRQELNKAKLVLCHFGTVYGRRIPTMLFQALMDLFQANRLTNKQICVRFVGVWEATDPKCEELAQFLEKVGLLKREAPLPHEACLREMAESDALLVIQPDSPLQIPGKIYEYIATRRPLLLLGGEGATANLVHRHRLGIVCSNKPELIEQMLLDLLEGRQSLPGPDPDEVDRFNYRRLTADLARVLDEVQQETETAKG